MKKILLLLCILIFVGNIKAQKVAYVDSQYILEHIPEYKQAKEELDNISYQWQEEIENAYQDIDKLYRAYQTDKVLLTDKMRQDREDEIIEKEKEVKELQQQRFGTDGDLYNKQEELIRPIQNLIYNAIQEFAEQGRYGVIFDKSSDLLMLYADENLDKSEKILDYLGYDY
ncbi:MAG: OmpH family outer membrane protein [Flavobacteriales bacterium]